MSSEDVVYLNLNEEPYLPLDGGRTSLPHHFVLVRDGQPLAVMAVSVDRLIDLVYVVPQARHQGLASALLRAAAERLGPLVHDDRLSAAGLGFVRARRVRYAGAGRRKAMMEAEGMERIGQAALEHSWAAYRRFVPA